MKYIIISMFLISISVITAQHSDLHIDGTIVISNSADTPQAGMIRYINGKFQGYDGVHWNQFTAEQIPNIELPEPPLTDIDGNEYCTVLINDEEWMCENLRVTKYRHGSPINIVYDSAEWVVSGKKNMTYYDNDIGFEEKHGALYNFHAIQGDSICPVGWKLPRQPDWDKLQLAAGIEGTSSIKEPGFWDSTLNPVGDHLGFKGRSSGARTAYSNFIGIELDAYWWANTQTNNQGHAIVVLSENNSFGKDHFPKEYGLSVRCIKN